MFKRYITVNHRGPMKKQRVRKSNYPMHGRESAAPAFKAARLIDIYRLDK